MKQALREHWPEYAIEGCLLGAFIISAAAFTSLLEYPASPLVPAIPDPFIRRMLIKIAMGATAKEPYFGIEQAYLNHVRGAELRITGLRGAGGPGVELLEYLRPGPGRPIPANERPSDIAHWQTTMELPDSPPAKLMRDPDGHALLVPKNLPE
jgi:hypothetical protein